MNRKLNLSHEFLVLAAQPAVSSQLCEAAASMRWQGPQDLRSICKASGIPSTQQGLVESVLFAAEKVGFCRQVSPLSWEPSLPNEKLVLLRDMLDGAATYKQSIHQDLDLVDVVLTRPPKPSRLEAALISSGYCYFGLEGTGETFEDMAAKATKRFTVMTPFLDMEGSTTLISLFKRTLPSVRRELILRYKDSTTPPEGFIRISQELQQLQVNCYNYRLERQSDIGYETFHAKVVLVDDRWCYVGSANMTMASFSFSMELGVSMRGQAAARIGNLVDAIVHISKAVRSD